MNFFGLSFPIGRYFGIPVRIHILFILFAYRELAASADVLGAFVYLLILWLSILVHEFGHALVARWCDGHADEIILWPLGGLAFCRSIFNPTAHFLTAIGGPMVSLALYSTSYILMHFFPFLLAQIPYAFSICVLVNEVNGMLFFFNMIPAFPMDGGRILRDLLWYMVGVEKATSIAVWLTRMIAIATVPLVLFTESYWFSQEYMLLFFAYYIFVSATAEQEMLHYEGPVQYFSIRDRLKRGRRKKQFDAHVMQIIEESHQTAFHRCATCGKTELQSKDLVFRVAQDGNEYCLEHLPPKPGTTIASIKTT